MATLYDAYGRKVDTGRLKEEQAAPTLSGIRNIYATLHPEIGLTPDRLMAMLRNAEFGDPYLYLELAEAMEEKDLHYLSVLGTRKRAVSQLDIEIVPASNSKQDQYNADLVEEMLLKGELNIEGDLFDVLDAIGKGFSATEIIWDQSGKVWTPKRLAWRDPRWFMFDWVSGTEILVRTLRTDGPVIPTQAPGSNPEGPTVGRQPATAPLLPFKWIQHIAKCKSGLPIRGGLARAAGWAYLFRNYVLKDWVGFAEVYGQPYRIGKYGPGATDADKEALLAAVANIGTDAAAIIPDSMLIEFLETQPRASIDMYEKLEEHLENAISKAVLGQTLTTQMPSRGGGSRAAAQVHEQVRGDIMRADRAQLGPTLDRDLIRPIIDLNVGPQQSYPRVNIVLPDSDDVQKFSVAVTAFVDRGLEVDQVFVRQKLGIPEPEEGAKLLYPAKSGGPADSSDSSDDDDQDQEDSDGDNSDQEISSAKKKARMIHRRWRNY
jgi:phage gp29-like protein